MLIDLKRMLIRFKRVGIRLESNRYEISFSSFSMISRTFLFSQEFPKGENTLSPFITTPKPQHPSGHQNQRWLGL